MKDRKKICDILYDLNIPFDISKYVITSYIKFCKHDKIDIYGRGDHCIKCSEEFFSNYYHISTLLYAIDRYSQRWFKAHERCYPWCISFCSDEQKEKHNLC